MTKPKKAGGSTTKKRDARISTEVRLFIIEQLANYMTPQAVAAAVWETFGLNISRQAVHYYDPTRGYGDMPAQKYADLFFAARKKALSDLEAQPLAHQAYRLAILHRMVNKADAAGNARLVADLLKQAAEELGGVYVRAQSSVERPTVVNLNLGYGARAAPDAPELHPASILRGSGISR